MLTKISFKKLFSRFDYDIDLKNDGITILTGPNGYGKSTILKSIKALYDRNLFFFAELEYETLEFVFDKESPNIKFNKTIQELNVSGAKLSLNNSEILRSLPKSLKDLIEKKIGETVEELDDDNMLKIKNHRKRFLHEDADSHKWFHHHELISEKFAQVFKSPSEVPFPKLDEEYQDFQKMLKKMLTASRSLGEIYFIKEQRLLKTQRSKNTRFQEINDSRTTEVISTIPTKVNKHIREVSSRYSTIANQLDRTYPERLFKTTTGINDQETYDTEMQKVNEKFKKLIEYDISELPKIENLKFKSEHAKALKIYFDDFHKKYQVYGNLIQKLDLFTSIINSHLSFKKIKISRDKGLEVVDDKENSPYPIQLDRLSSGEKQEIVMFYELIFETNDGALLLIDEPEISLHILWQRKFMDDLDEVIKQKNGMQAIVATHAPGIIGNKWDLQVDLGELYNGR